MTDRPIIFSGPMVCAQLAGLKTQTRRILKPQPPTEEQFRGSSFGINRAVADDVKVYSQNDYDRLPKHPTKWELVGSVGVARDAGFAKVYDVRYAVGDRLYVRERCLTITGGAYRGVKYIADGHDSGDWDRANGGGEWDVKSRPSIHMPRWASRITLTVTDVRVERLQDISEEDAKAEGAIKMLVDEDDWKFYESAAGTYRCGFLGIWSHIHGREAWASNPWIVAVTFTVEQRNIDVVLS